MSNNSSRIMPEKINDALEEAEKNGLFWNLIRTFDPDEYETRDDPDTSQTLYLYIARNAEGDTYPHFVDYTLKEPWGDVEGKVQWIRDTVKQLLSDGNI